MSRYRRRRAHRRRRATRRLIDRIVKIVVWRTLLRFLDRYQEAIEKRTCPPRSTWNSAARCDIEERLRRCR